MKHLKSLKLAERKKYINSKIFCSSSEKLNEWKNSPAFLDNNILWEKKLESINLKEDELIEYLGVPLKEQRIFEPEFSNMKSYILNPSESFFSNNFPNVPLAFFFDLLNEQIRNSQSTLNDMLTENIKDSYFDLSNITRLLSYNIADTLFDIIYRTLVLEMNVQRIKGDLKGLNPSERFSYFVQLLKDKKFQSQLFSEYPILLRQVTEFLDRWVVNNYELISRLVNDWGNICKEFLLDETVQLKKIQINAGDLHNNGKSVTILHFNNNKKIVYKPRDLASDIHFQNLLEFLNSTSIHLKFRLLKIINYKTHGWVEFIENLECDTIDQVENYYTRLGYAIFVLFMLNATDFHHENIIACGEFPILIDLETLFNPYQVPNNYRENSASYKIFDFISKSVLSTALLPWRSNLKGKFVDISGMTDVSQNNPEMPKTAWDSEATDFMSITRKMVKFEVSPNTPKMRNEQIDPFKYFDFIIKGFEEVSKFVINNKLLFIGEKGILKVFIEDEIRILFRQTQEYAQLINSSFHPDFLRDPIDREILFDYLWMQIPSNPILAKIVNSEQESLHKMDIPLFKCKINSTDLYDAFGEIYYEYFKKSGYQIVLDKINNFTLPEMEQQKWLIKASIEPYIKPSNKNVNYKYENDFILQKENLVKLSLTIFKKLIDDAWEEKNDINWFGIYSDISSNASNICPLQMDFYLGKPGVILYLAYLWKITNNKRVETAFFKLIETFQEDVQNIDYKILSSVGTFSGGLSGLIYLYSHLTVILQEEQYYLEAMQFANHIDDDLENLSNDIIDGKAGIILSLISLYSLKKDKNCLEKIVKIAHSICQQVENVQNGGIGWKDSTGKFLSGFAHGVSGISYALSEVYKLTKDEYYLYYIKESIKYENSLYLDKINNWLDLREFDIEAYKSKEMTAWCNGAVGIGLNRIFISKLFPEDLCYQEDLKNAIKKTINDGFGRNHTLCHGDMGNIEFLMLAINHCPSLKIEDTYKKIASSVCGYIHNNGGVCSTATGLPTYGIMTGLSGVGFQLLRIAYPERVPSILILEAPKYINF